MSKSSQAGAIIQAGSIVSLYFVLKLEDGQLIERTEDQQPLRLCIGSDDMDEGLESLLLGRKAGDKEEIVVGPGIAFGDHDESNIHSLPRKDFSDTLLADIPEGEERIIEFNTPSGETTPGRVLSWDDENVRIDFNHPLAGLVLRFEFEVLGVN
jgi:FKBP-type peptidyl-prolyl cis-trans isomerase SlpA